MIIIYSKENDEFVNDVISFLPKQRILRLSHLNGAFVQNVEVINDKNIEFSIYNEFVKPIKSNDIESIWYHGGSVLSNEKIEKLSKLEAHELYSLSVVINDNLQFLTKNTIGSIKNNLDNNKIKELETARECGITVPATLLTNSKEKLRNFMAKYDQEGIIFKRIGNEPFLKENEWIYDTSKTQQLDKAMFESLPKKFGLSLFQEKIKKRFEIRSIFLKDSFFSAAIFETNKTVDYRVKLNSNEFRIIPFELPLKTKNKLKLLLKKLGYVYASIDLIFSNNNDYVFLEINPSGQISFVNNTCNYYLESKVAKYLKNE